MAADTLSPAQSRLLLRLFQGDTLKDHRYLDGSKVYKLHPLDGPPETVHRATVEVLRRRGLIESNKKFPAATYLLTPAGRALGASLA
jgi:hypothetical protein